MGGINIHRIYIGFLILVVLLAASFLAYQGYSYYSLGIEQRFFHSDHQTLKPSGLLGHTLGILGSLLMLIGVSTYMLHKRFSKFSRIGVLKYWLEFHIFLCTLGPIFVLYHTAFKFGGLVAVSFWSMIAVVLSGVIGRYIYLQIPRTIEGREMNLSEINQIKDELNNKLITVYNIEEKALQEILNAVKMRPDRSGNSMVARSIAKFKFERKTIHEVKKILRYNNVTGKVYKEVIKLIKDEINLNRKIDRLISMQSLFKYWHVAHLPFALLMLIIMLIHVGVAITFGAHWIF
jgi:preprotein translocase subunit Sec61beta